MYIDHPLKLKRICVFKYLDISVFRISQQNKTKTILHLIIAMEFVNTIIQFLLSIIIQNHSKLGNNKLKQRYIFIFFHPGGNFDGFLIFFFFFAK